MKLDKAHLYKQPTAEEISRLRETELLYNSNLFRLQIEQLLDEIKVKEKYQKLFNGWFEELQSFFDSLVEYDFNTSVLGTEINQKFLKKLVKVRECDMKTDQDLHVNLKKPTQITLYGLQTFNALVGPKFVINIGITIPEDCLLPGDYLNNRFNIKRFYYVSYIYYNLKSGNLCSDITFENYTLKIVPNCGQNIFVNITVLPPDNYFKLVKFEPLKNNIRENYFDTPYTFNTTTLKQSGTPFYNSQMLHDLTLIHNYKLFQETFKDLRNVKDGIKLIILWLQKRNLYSVQFGMTELLLLHIVLYLSLKRKLNKHMSSYQVVRNFWVFLSTTNWNETPISIYENVTTDTFKMFQQNFDVVFLDASGFYNVAAFLQYEVYLKLRNEAQLAVTFVDNITFDSFGGLFMNNMNPEVQYDALLILNDKDGFKKVFDVNKDTEKCKYVGFHSHLILKSILSMLRKGLNKRILQLVPINLEYSSKGICTKITIGITLDPNNAFSLIEKGPEANTYEATEFKHFWGSLSECRRFVDGSICEAVYFPSKTVQEKRKIFQIVINFVVTEKIKVESHYILADQFEHMLVSKNSFHHFQNSTCEEASLNVIVSFDEIAKILRESKLPLNVVTVQGATQVFCYTAINPPVPTNYHWNDTSTTFSKENIVFKKPFQIDTPKFVEPIECIFQLGMNSKWPHDLKALRYVQLGFYLELSKYLKEKNILSQVGQDCLTVLYKGLVFHFRLYNPKEIAILRKYIQPDGTVAFQDTQESIRLEYKLNTLPRLIGALHGLQAEYPSFGPSSTIIKCWLRAQLIDEYHIPDVVIDLLNAYLFINSTPYQPANLPQVAFLRFLKFVAESDWSLQQIIVNFNTELTKELIDNFETNFQQIRHNYPPLCIITPYDDGKSAVSKNCSVEILNRLSVLAKSTYEVVAEGISIQNLSVIKDLFVPNLDGYHVLIHIKPSLNNRCFQNNSKQKWKYKIHQYKPSNKSKIPITNFSMVDIYLKELRQYYDDFALFFHNSYGGNIIGVLWKPKMLEKKPFKISHIDGRKLNHKDLILNVEAIVNDFSIIGEDLVEKVEQLRNFL
ncbi:hypothetical protein FQA39_LY18252 [Lamprigera yunnana]|nr:hypothetical protein FQA39_LY18252 [Lamprigera yunnana]